MPSRILTHDLFGHAATQSVVFGTVATTPRPWAAMGAAVLGAFATWILQETSKGLWRQIAVLEGRVVSLEALRCPRGPEAVARCQAAEPAAEEVPALSVEQPLHDG